MLKAGRVIAGLATVFFAASLAACSGGGSIATVNGQSISRAAFDAKLEAGPAAIGTLQEMVRDALIDQYAQKHHIVVTNAEILKHEDELKANFPAGSWSEMLKARGLTEKDVHDALRQQIIVDDAVGKGITITPAQIKAYFDKNHAAFDKPAEVRARHILVADLKTADKIEADLKAGQRFSVLAEKYSMDPGSKDKGGELGWFRRGQMVPAFDKAAFSLPIGKISAPVKSPFGYHIIQVQQRQPAVMATLANSSARIESLLRQQQEAPLIQPFLQNLQQEATITVSDPRYQAAFPSPPPTPVPTATPAATASPAASAAPTTSASP
jgi:foldase protein PrsA